MLSEHLIPVIKDQIVFKATQFSELAQKEQDADSKTKVVAEFVKESLDYLISLLEPVQDQRDELFNQMAAKYNIKVLHSTKKMPMQLEMVRENFREIINSLKFQETRQIEMELKIQDLQTKTSI